MLAARPDVPDEVDALPTRTASVTFRGARSKEDSTTTTLFKYSTDTWSRTRATRVTLVELTDEERQELQECFELLDDTNRGELLYTDLIKAADLVLGPGNYSVSKLRQAMEEMDLNHNGSIDFYEFRAYMSTNWSASKSADQVMGAARPLEDMILVAGNTRLADLVRAFRRRIRLNMVILQKRPLDTAAADSASTPSSCSKAPTAGGRRVSIDNGPEAAALGLATRRSSITFAPGSPQPMSTTPIGRSLTQQQRAIRHASLSMGHRPLHLSGGPQQGAELSSGESSDEQDRYDGLMSPNAMSSSMQGEQHHHRQHLRAEVADDSIPERQPGSSAASPSGLTTSQPAGRKPRRPVGKAASSLGLRTAVPVAAKAGRRSSVLVADSGPSTTSPHPPLLPGGNSYSRRASAVSASYDPAYLAAGGQPQSDGMVDCVQVQVRPQRQPAASGSGSGSGFGGHSWSSGDAVVLGNHKVQVLAHAATSLLQGTESNELTLNHLQSRSWHPSPVQRPPSPSPRASRAAPAAGSGGDGDAQPSSPLPNQPHTAGSAAATAIFRRESGGPGSSKAPATFGSSLGKAVGGVLRKLTGGLISRPGGKPISSSGVPTAAEGLASPSASTTDSKHRARGSGSGVAAGREELHGAPPACSYASITGEEGAAGVGALPPQRGRTQRGSITGGGGDALPRGGLVARSHASITGGAPLFSSKSFSHAHGRRGSIMGDMLLQPGAAAASAAGQGLMPSMSSAAASEAASTFPAAEVIRVAPSSKSLSAGNGGAERDRRITSGDDSGTGCVPKASSLLLEIQAQARAGATAAAAATGVASQHQQHPSAAPMVVPGGALFSHGKRKGTEVLSW